MAAGADVAGDNVIEGNYIGVDITGEAGLPNNVGIEMQDVTGNTIQNNLIGFNNAQGILAVDPLGTNAQFGNLILGGKLLLNDRITANTVTSSGVLSVNTGFVRERTEWTHQNNIDIGDIPADKKLTFDQIADHKLAEEAVVSLGGPVTINGCKD